MDNIRDKVKIELPKQISEVPKVREGVDITAKKDENKKSLTDSRFERHKAFDDLIKRNEIAEKVKQGLLKWVFYAIDNDNGYQYYIKIKK